MGSCKKSFDVDKRDPTSDLELLCPKTSISSGIPSAPSDVSTRLVDWVAYMSNRTDGTTFLSETRPLAVFLSKTPTSCGIEFKMVMPLSLNRGFKSIAPNLEPRLLVIGERLHGERSPSTIYFWSKCMLRTRNRILALTMPKHISSLWLSVPLSEASVPELKVEGVQVLAIELGTSNGSYWLVEE